MAIALANPTGVLQTDVTSASDSARAIFFLDDHGDWAATSVPAEAAGHTLGVVFLDADGDVAIDVALPIGATLLRTALIGGAFISY